MTRPRPLVVANYKAQLTPRRERELVREVARRLLASPSLSTEVELLIAPSALSLVPINETLAELGLAIGLAAQDCSAEPAGPHTGELSAAALATTAEAVLIGHAERRAAGEHGATLGRKLARAIEAGLRPILCFDDPTDAALATRGAHFAREWELISEAAAREGIDEAAIARSGLLLAYEPQGAIGSGVPLPPSAAGEAAATLRDVVGAARRILYGGSVVGDGAAAYLDQPDAAHQIDGLLVGGAALEADRLFAILSSVRRTNGAV